MTATRALILSVTVAVAAALTGMPGFAAGAKTAAGVRLKTISVRNSAKGASLVIEASEPVPYVATSPDALTVLIDLRSVAADGVANTVSPAAGSPIAAVSVEQVDAADVIAAPMSRLRISLTQAVAHRVRSDRNTIVVDFDRLPASGAPRAVARTNALPVDPIAILGLGLAAPAPVLPAGTAALLLLTQAQAQQPVPPAVPPPAPATSTSISAAPEQKKYTGTPVNFDLEDADLAGVLRLFQDISGLNMVIDPGVAGKVNLVLKDVPWDQALDVVLKQNKLGLIVEDTIVRISPLSVLAEEQTQRRKLSEEQALSGDLRVMTKTLSYAKVAEMAPLLKTLLSTRGTVQLDPRTNTLIVTDLQDRLDTISNLVGTLDRAEPQVEIEARIVQTNQSFAKAIGVQWGFNGRVDPALGNTTNLAFPNNGSLGGRAGAAGTSTAVNLPANGATSVVGLALGSVNGSFNLDVALSALEQSGQGKLLSTPKISTQNNVEAEIAQGVRVPYQTTANNTITTNFVDATLKLTVTPQITAAGTVIMKIFVDKGSIGQTFNGVPSINTQRANTTVLVNDGETTVIGGIFEGNETKSKDGTPGLSRVPLLGWLFKRETADERNTELLIFITPRIVSR